MLSIKMNFFKKIQKWNEILYRFCTKNSSFYPYRLSHFAVFDTSTTSDFVKKPHFSDPEKCVQKSKVFSVLAFWILDSSLLMFFTVFSKKRVKQKTRCSQKCVFCHFCHFWFAVLSFLRFRTKINHRFRCHQYSILQYDLFYIKIAIFSWFPVSKNFNLFLKNEKTKKAKSTQKRTSVFVEYWAL